MSANFKMKPHALYAVPLGGCGIFGANMTLYGYQGKWIMVDCGMGFADDTMPGIELILPDPEFAESLGDDLLAIIITHSHEDHIGGIQYLWPRIKAPIYATKFNVLRIAQAVSERPWGDQTMLNQIEEEAEFAIGDFHLQFINVAHSIPESSALAITVEDVGTVLHTGDWKIDPTPVESNVINEKAFKALGKKGVLALFGDSTNAMVPGHSGSELDVQKNLIELFKEFKGKPLGVTCFATNVARMHSIAVAAERSGRQVCMVGRSMNTINRIARDSGYLKGLAEFITDDEAQEVAAEKLVYMCTGSQGEPRAALARIAMQDHPRVKFGENTTVIFSSKTIPGNEKAVDRIKNNLYALGVNIITENDAMVHVSGHPYRDELKQMYDWVKPKTAVPVHGEYMQQEKHAELAKECCVLDAFIPSNGDVLEISPKGDVTKLTEVPAGILAVEGNRIVPVEHEAIAMRKRIMWHGSAVVTVVVNKAGRLLAPPQVTALGLLDDDCELDQEHLQQVEWEVEMHVENMPKSQRVDDYTMEEGIRITARRFFKQHFNRKPQTRVHLVRVD